MKVQFDVHTKYFTLYRLNFARAFCVTIHNWRRLKAVHIWIYKE